MAKPPLAQRKAMRFLLALIERSRAASQSRLPPIAELARRAGVSPVTMHKAVTTLRRQGVVETSHGRGTTVRRPAPAASLRSVKVFGTQVRQRPSGPKWQRLRMRMGRDIVDGRFISGSLLPSTKDLLTNYGVSYPTLRKAVATLVSDGWLEQERTRYRVPSLGSGRAGNAIALIARGNERGDLLVMSPRIEEHLRTLERECARSRTRLLVYCYDSDSRLLHGAHEGPVPLARLGAERVVLGALVWQIGYSGEALAGLLDGLARTRLPVAVLDELGPPEIDIDARTWPRVRFFSIAGNITAGRQMGRFLLGLGHREVAYISPVHASDWSQGRLRGLCEVYEEAGLGSAVHVFSLDVHDQFEFLERLRKRLRQPASPLQMAGFGQAHLVQTYTSERIEVEIQNKLEHRAMGLGLASLLEEALACRAVTAWVAPSDSVALLCLEFLRGRGAQVPDELSVAGFDDGLDAFLHRLTSYNFNGTAALNAMLAHVLGAPKRPGDRAAHVLAFDGFVTERSTTGASRHQEG